MIGVERIENVSAAVRERKVEGKCCRVYSRLNNAAQEIADSPSHWQEIFEEFFISRFLSQLIGFSG
jgi:hypothetical protein